MSGEDEEIKVKKKKRLNWEQKIQQSWEDDRKILEASFDLTEDVLKRVREKRKKTVGDNNA